MTVEEALKWVHPSNPSITQDLECARVLAAEVERLRVELRLLDEDHNLQCQCRDAYRQERDDYKLRWEIEKANRKQESKP